MPPGPLLPPYAILPCDLAQKFSLIGFSFMVWVVVFLTIYSRPPSTRLIEKLRRESQEVSHHPMSAVTGTRLAKQELATRLSAFLHAAIVGFGAFYILFLNPQHAFYYKNFLQSTTTSSATTLPNASGTAKGGEPFNGFTAQSPDVVLFACISSGYFIADIILTTILFEENGFVFLMHAVAGFTGCFYCAMSEYGLGYFSFLLLVEVSTPFLHFRWWLLEYGFKASPIYVLNGLVLVATFSIFRIFMGIPLMSYMIYELHTPPQNAIMNVYVRYILSFFAMALCAMNLQWGAALWKGFLKTVFGSSAAGRTEKQHMHHHHHHHQNKVVDGNNNGGAENGVKVE